MKKLGLFFVVPSFTGSVFPFATGTLHPLTKHRVLTLQLSPTSTRLMSIRLVGENPTVPCYLNSSFLIVKLRCITSGSSRLPTMPCRQWVLPLIIPLNILRRIRSRESDDFELTATARPSSFPDTLEPVWLTWWLHIPHVLLCAALPTLTLAFLGNSVYGVVFTSLSTLATWPPLPLLIDEAWVTCTGTLNSLLNLL